MGEWRGGIYGWRFIPTGEIRYVGKAKNLERRRIEHVRSYEGGSCRALYSSMRRHGIDSYEFVVLQDGIDDPIWLLLAEGQWARDLNTLHRLNPSGLNLTDPWGDRDVISLQTLEKMSNASKQRYKDPEYMTKIVSSRRAQASSITIRAKISSGVLEWHSRNRQMFLESMKKLHASPEWLSKVTESNRAKAKTDEWISKVIDGSRRKCADPTWIANNAEGARKRQKPVICIETLVCYQSGKIASTETKLPASSISHACRDHRRSAGGYHWRYATQEEIEAMKAKEESVV